MYILHVDYILQYYTFNDDKFTIIIIPGGLMLALKTQHNYKRDSGKKNPIDDWDIQFLTSKHQQFATHKNYHV